MTRILVAFIAACIAVVAVVGCSSSASEQQRIINRIQSLLSDANREDLIDTMENYSFDYCDDVDFCGGGTYQDERDCWQNTFNDPGTFVRFSDLRVIRVEIDPNETQGFIDATVRFTLFDNLGNFITEGDYSFRMFMIKEGNTWLMWGDGQCFDSPKTFVPWKDRVGKETRSGHPPTRKK